MNLLEAKLFNYYDITPAGQKMPFGLDGKPGIRAKAGSYSQAAKGKRRRQYTGIGFLIKRERPEVFVDLDDYDPRFLLQENILRVLGPTSYLHRSSSKRGYHLITQVRDKKKYSTIKQPGVEIYVADRFCALVNPLESESVPLSDVPKYDNSEMFHYLYSALQFLHKLKSDEQLLSLLRRGKILEFPSPSEFDHAVVAEALKHTVEFDVVYGLLLLSESDLRRLELGKTAKITERPDYVRRTMKQLVDECDEYVVTEDFNQEDYEQDNLIYLGGKPFARRKTITVIKALLNSGKGHFALSVMSVVEAKKGTDSLSAEMNMPVEKVLYVDTEMGRELTANMKGMVHRRLGKRPSKFVFATIKSVKVEDRFGVIYSLLRAHKADVVIIDGVRDLIRSFNDIDSSNDLIHDLTLMAETSNCSIIVTIHTNLGQEVQKARGHLGSELEQKAFAVFLLERDKNNKDLILIKQSKARVSGFFEDFAMAWDYSKGYFVRNDIKGGTHGTVEDRRPLDL